MLRASPAHNLAPDYYLTVPTSILIRPARKWREETTSWARTPQPQYPKTPLGVRAQLWLSFHLNCSNLGRVPLAWGPGGGVL